MIRFKPLTQTVPKGVAAAAASVPEESGINKVAQNLLAHIPAEASGFYLMAIAAVKTEGAPSRGDALLFGLLSLLLLILVRWLAAASRGVFATSILAFLLWMAVLDVGALHVWGLGIEGARGAMLAAFYSTVVTLLASAGKLE